MPSTLEFARENYRLADTLRAEMRSIEETCNAEKRGFTAAESARVEELTVEIRDAGARGRAMLDQALDPTVSALEEAVQPDTSAVYDFRSQRPVGALPAIEFREEDLRSLHDAYMSGRPHDIETRAVVDALPMGQNTYLNRVTPIRREPTRIASYMGVQPITTRQVTYYKQSAAATAAATVAEGADKPESAPDWSPETATARKIAHYFDVTTEALADYADFENIVRAEGVAGLIHAENLQLLNGDGTAPNISGLTDVSGTQTFQPDTAEKYHRVVRKAMTLLRTGSSYTEADTLLVHPSDWETIDLTEDTTGQLVRFPWSVPVVQSTAVTAGTALVANLADAAVVFLREAPKVMVDPYSQSKANKVRFIFEERLDLGVIRPASVVRSPSTPRSSGQPGERPSPRNPAPRTSLGGHRVGRDA